MKHSDQTSIFCKDCKFFQDKVAKYQTHGHTFTYSKKGKTITINASEGHGRKDRSMIGRELLNIPICRFNIPKFPMDRTKLIVGIRKDLDEKIVDKRKKDLNKIKKYLIRQTFTESRLESSENWNHLEKMNFLEFLFEVGMFEAEQDSANFDENDINNAKERYYNAISVSVKGTGSVFLKREVKDIFTNGYNRFIMILHVANHDIQPVIDQYACAQYVCGYLTKNEAGISKLLKAVNDESNNLRQMDKLNKLAAILDKHREVSVQEAVYRILGLPMTKSSIKVKYISSIHPHFRDGLLKGDIDHLSDSESIFHTSPHQYYENRPKSSADIMVKYDDEEVKKDYWDNMSVTDFWSDYEIVYDKSAKSTTKVTRIQTLLNGKGFIRKRAEPAVLRYYINYDNDEDMARSLLILFLPFRNEMEDIHNQDVKSLLKKKGDIVEEKRKRFEKYKVMSDLISNIQKEEARNVESEDEDDLESKEEETTSPEQIEEFNSWAKQQAKKDLSKLKDFVNICSIDELRSNISSLNYQQRRLFDDVLERMVSDDINEKTFYLFITGNAGTGKSHLVQILSEAIKSVKLKSGVDLKKPSILITAPTANAAFIIGGRTIDSVLGFSPSDQKRYVQTNPGRLSQMKFQYEDVEVIFIDEISMVGSAKLSKIHFRFQDLADGENKLKFMGGTSLVASGNYLIYSFHVNLKINSGAYHIHKIMLISGDLWQLPPIYDVYITENNCLDGRPEFSPSHWKENFKIYYLTEKMRSKKDLEFSNICDRVGRGQITEKDEEFLRSRIQVNEIENNNENFKIGIVSIIVTTNMKKDLINSKKLKELLPNKKEYECNSVDRILNLPSGLTILERDQHDLKTTGNLPKVLKLKEGAPIVITSNHSKSKYREDGIVNGARGFVQAIQVSKDNPEKVDVIWIVLNNEKMGRLYRFEHDYLKQSFNPGHPLATPILPERKKFCLRGGNVEYQRTNFALSLAYAITAHKCQGQTLEFVIIDFGPEPEHKIKNFICHGSFYVALTRVREGAKVFLRSFDKSYIAANEKLEENINAMRKFNSYQFKKMYIDEQIFINEDHEIKAGYLNINGLIDGGHAEYLNEDKNLIHLHVLVVSETKLDRSVSTSNIEVILTNWNVIHREDAADGSKHMGLILISPKSSTTMTILKSLRYQKVLRHDKLHIQGLIVRFTNQVKIGFVYCRSTPTEIEVNSTKKTFRECNILMGDFNLSTKKEAERKKIDSLCHNTKYQALKEITRRMSNNQPDHVLVDKAYKNNCYVTSFFNFISDHNTIVARIGDANNEFTDETRQKILFNSESHLKAKFIEQKESKPKVHRSKIQSSSTPMFQRKIVNPDMSSCWLNACLQLLLTAFDHADLTFEFYSELGKELFKINEQTLIDPTYIKEIMVFAEDTRISIRKSEVIAEIPDPDEQKRQLRNIDEIHLNLGYGQQCVRDFFLCLSENVQNWIDLYEFISFHTVDSTMCLKCKHTNQIDQRNIYVEMEVPPEGSSLSKSVEELFNESYLVEYFCEACKEQFQAEKRLILNCVQNTQFIILLLRRAVQGDVGNIIVGNLISATDDIKLM